MTLCYNKNKKNTQVYIYAINENMLYVEEEKKLLRGLYMNSLK